MTTNDDTEEMPEPVGTGAADAQLVAAYLGGDRSALGGIYDRHGSSLFDTAAAMTGSRDDAADMVQDVFVIAAERLGQLRDPSRLRPWLFAILRNEVFRRSRRRSRSVVTDFSAPEREVMVPTSPPESERVDDELDAAELAELVRGAARGLDARDQLVLELSVRQGLTGSDLADALGVSAQQGYGLVHRMRERTERSLGAYCVARRGRRDCEELAGILAGWDGEFTVLLRKRVARHIETCSTCERTRRRFLPLGLVGAAPAFAAPIGLRDRIMEQVLALDSPQASPGESGAEAGVDAATGFPLLDGVARSGRRLLGLVAGTAAVSLIAVGGLLVSGGGDPPATVGPTVTDPAGDGLITDETTTSVMTPPTIEAPTTVVVTTPDTTTTAPTTEATDAVAPTGTEPPAATTTTRPRTTTPPATTVPATTAAPQTQENLGQPAEPTPTDPPATTAPKTTTPPTTAANRAPSLGTPTSSCTASNGTYTIEVAVPVGDEDGDVTVVRADIDVSGMGESGSLDRSEVTVTGSGTARFTVTLVASNGILTITADDGRGGTTTISSTIGPDYPPYC